MSDDMTQSGNNQSNSVEPQNLSEIDTLKLALESSKKEAQVNLDGWRRANADYQNLKKDTDKRMETMTQTAKIFLLADFLDVYDNFKVACKTIEGKNQSDGKVDKALYDGIIQIEKQFEELLVKWNVKRVETIGQRFNPEMHEAIGEESSDESVESVAEQVVVKEFTSGYSLNGIMIKPAKVMVGPSK